MQNVHYKFLDVGSSTDLENANVAIIQAPLEKTTSFQHGTAKGPQAFLQASKEVELYDVDQQFNYSDQLQIYTFPPSFSHDDSSEESLLKLEEQVSVACNHDVWPLVVGGEHTITQAPVAALKKKYSDLSVLQWDAHADLRDSYEGSKLSHASVMKRVADLNVPHVGVGIRNYCEEEKAYIDDHNTPIFHNLDILNNGMPCEKISSKLSPNVYITVDVDGFDPSVFPGTGTPEPEGLTWTHAMTLFSYIFKHHNVVGVDINEIMPLPGNAQTEFFAAKLAYKLIGMKFCSDKFI